MFLESLIAAVCIALLSMSGILIFGHRGGMRGTHRYILPVAVGVFLGVVFFELIPETLEMSSEFGPIAIAIGFLGFYLFSYVLSTYHHHHSHAHHAGDDCIHSSGRKLLIGDAVHNFADGIVIASTFLIHPSLGVATAIGIALHEIPQEIAEFGVLVQSGYTKTRALILNLFSASMVIVGVLLTFLFQTSLEGSLFIITGIAAGNLLYIATADLIPELRVSHQEHFWQTFLATIVGIVAIGFLLQLSH